MAQTARRAWRKPPAVHGANRAPRQPRAAHRANRAPLAEAPHIPNRSPPGPN
jgi:hypothetical protein